MTRKWGIRIFQRNALNYVNISKCSLVIDKLESIHQNATKQKSVNQETGGQKQRGLQVRSV